MRALNSTDILTDKRVILGMRTALCRLAAVTMIVCCLLCFSSCGGDSDKDRHEIQGFQITKLQVCRVTGDSYNFLVGITNPFGENRYFDAGKFVLKLESGDEIPHMAGNVSTPANNYELHSFMISESHPKMSVGDKVTVFYGDNEICGIKITEIDG